MESACGRGGVPREEGDVARGGGGPMTHSSCCLPWLSHFSQFPASIPSCLFVPQPGALLHIEAAVTGNVLLYTNSTHLSPMQCIAYPCLGAMFRSLKRLRILKQRPPARGCAVIDSGAPQVHHLHRKQQRSRELRVFHGFGMIQPDGCVNSILSSRPKKNGCRVVIPFTLALFSAIKSF